MKVRTLLILTAIVSSTLGALVVYLVLTVPNDLQADALLRSAGRDITAGRNDSARTALARLIQQYPRTDGAAAGMVLLIRLSDDDRHKLERELHTQTSLQKKQFTELAEKVNQLTTRDSAPVAAVVSPTAGPAAAPATVAEVTAPKSAPRKRATRHHRSRRRRH